MTSLRMSPGFDILDGALVTVTFGWFRFSAEKLARLSSEEWFDIFSSTSWTFIFWRLLGSSVVPPPQVKFRFVAARNLLRTVMIRV